jgi:predicted RND superfamily exporter protein
LRARELFVAWCVLFAAVAYTGPQLFNHTSVQFKSAPRTPSYLAQQRSSRWFPGESKVVEAVIYVEGEHNLIETGGLLKDLTKRVVARYSVASEAVPYACTIQGYYPLLSANQSASAEAFLNEDKNASILVVSRFPAEDINPNLLGRDLLDFVAEVREDYAYAHLWVGAGGMPVLVYESSVSTKADVARSDKYVIPLALLVLGFMINSWRLLIVTLLNFLTAVFSACSVMFLLAKCGLIVSTLTPGVMSCILLAVSIDYSLFMLTRLTEEVNEGSTIEAALEASLVSSGHTVLGSGFTLALCFLALCFFPLKFMQSMGLGVALTIIFAILSNLLLTPVLIFTFPVFFAVEPGGSPWCCCLTRRVSVELIQEEEPSLLWKIAVHTTDRWWTVCVIVLTVVAVVVLTPVALELKKTGDILQFVPRQSLAVETTLKVNHAFSSGFLNPYNLVIAPDAGERPGVGPVQQKSIFTPEFFAEAREVLQSVTTLFPPDGRSSIISPMFIYGKFSTMFDPSMIPDEVVIQILKQCHDTWDKTQPQRWWFGNPAPCEAGRDCCVKTFADGRLRGAIRKKLKRRIDEKAANELAGMVGDMLRMTVNDDGTAIRARVAANYGMGTDAGLKFTRDVRSLTGSRGASECWLTAGDTEITDVVDSIDAVTFPILFTTSLVVIIVVGFLYGSAAIPIRSLVTILLTQITAFAALVAVYQYGLLDFLGLGPFSNLGGVNFMIPSIAYTVVLGLALDYDVFLIGRIVEFRQAGFSDKDAIQLGMWKTSVNITAAGVIMAIAFSGNFFSGVGTLNVMGTVLVSAVLVNTIVLRHFTPALMAPLGQVNWYPRAMPVPNDIHAESFVVAEEAEARLRLSHRESQRSSSVAPPLNDSMLQMTNPNQTMSAGSLVNGQRTMSVLSDNGPCPSNGSNGNGNGLGTSFLDGKRTMSVMSERSFRDEYWRRSEERRSGKCELSTSPPTNGWRLSTSPP